MTKELKFLTYCASQAYAYFKRLRDDCDFREERQVLLRQELQKIKKLNMEEIRSKVPFSFEIPDFNTSYDLPPDCNYHFCEHYDFSPLMANAWMYIKINDKRVPTSNDVDTKFMLVVFEYIEKAKSGNLHKLCKDIMLYDRNLGFKLREYVLNIIHITPNTTTKDILMQLIIFAFQQGFLKNDKDALDTLIAYITPTVKYLSKGRIKNIEEIVSDTIKALITKYLRPFEGYSFKAYITGVAMGLIRTRNRSNKFAYVALQENSKETSDEPDIDKSDEDHVDDSDIASINQDYYKFTTKEGEIQFGVDRVAIQTDISRDTIYRYLRKGKLKPFYFESGKRKYLTLNQEQVNHLISTVTVKKKLIRAVSNWRKITQESARKRINRKLRKGMTLKDIYSKRGY